MTTSNQSLSYQEPDLWRDRGAANMLLTGGHGASFNTNGDFKWTTRFIAMDGGRDPDGSSIDGHFSIEMPPLGTVITGVAGAANKTVTAAGILVANSWLSLWYELPAAKTSTTDFANFKISSYTADFVIPDNWILITSYNMENSLLKLGTGEFMVKGTVNSLPSVRRGGQAQVGDLVVNVVPNGFSEYADFNGLWSPNITLPVAGRYVGDVFTFNHQAGFDTSINTTNTTMAVPYLVTVAKAGASFIWLGTKWAFMA